MSRLETRLGLTAPPGPPPHRRWQIARNATSLLGLLRDPLAFVAGRFAEHGSTYYVREPAGTELYVTRELAVARDVLVTHAGAFTKAGGANDVLRPFLGNGLLISDGELWRAQRRRIQPAFLRRRIEGYAPTMVSHARDLPWTDGAHTDVFADMMRLTLRVACKTLFDHDARHDADDVAAAMDGLRRAAHFTVLPYWIPGSSAARGRAALGRLHAVLDGMVARRRRDGPRDDLLSMLLDAEGGAMDHDLLRDELVTLFLAGHETTSHALTWTWMLLSQHPEAEARVHAEVDALGRDPTAADVPALPFTEAVIKEALRLYPPAFALPRVAQEEVSVGGLRLAPGAQVVTWVWHLHRDPALFDDPTSFRPERHLDPTYDRHAWMPFGAGPRMCVGAGFAMLELVLVVAAIAQRWRARLTGDPPVTSPRVTLGPKGGMPMRVSARS